MIDLVVLAAGRGRRLGTSGDETPKWLLEVGDATLAERQLEGARQVAQHSPDLIASVRVVVGHEAPAIKRFASQIPDQAIGLVENPSYDELNNWYSLLLALRVLDDADVTERVVVFNADLLARPEWFARFLIDSSATSSEALIAVDTVRALSDESMKVSVFEDHPHLLEQIGKSGIEDPLGEYVGMLMVRGKAREGVRAALESYVGSGSAANHWYEQAIGETACNGVPWVIWPTPDSDWVEIDDEADYASALQMERLR